MTNANENTNHGSDMCEASTRISNLIQLTDELSAVFSQENALLVAQRPNAIAPLQAEKAKLATAYAIAIREIATDRYLVDGADDTLLSTLREVTTRFNALANDQRNLLSGANAATTAVVQAIADEASKQSVSSAPQSPAPGYAHNARMPRINAAPISINERA